MAVALPQELQALSAFVDERPEALISSNSGLSNAALDATRFLFDLAVQSESQSFPHVQGLISSLTPSEAPQTRSSAKRKRSSSPPPKQSSFSSTPLGSLYVEGMDVDQIWNQLDLRAKNICQVLDKALLEEEEEEEPSSLEDEGSESYEDDDEGLEIDALDDEDAFLDEEGDMEETDDEEEESDGEDDPQAFGVESIAELRDPSDEEDNDDDLEARTLLDKIRKGPASSKKRRKGTHPELDDDFFDLAAFNAETEEAEARNVSSGRLGGEDDEEDDDEEDDALVDLFAPVDEDEAFDEEDLEEQPDLFYKDFFDPPQTVKAKKGKKPEASKEPKDTKRSGSVRFHDEVRVKSIKPRGKGAPLSSLYDTGDEEEDEQYLKDDPSFTFGDVDEEESDDDEEMLAENEDEENEEEEEEMSEAEEEDGHETIARLKGDLFADDEGEDDSEEDLTTHEKRQRALRDQIADFESENTDKKDWVLMGEATSRTRPHNSLLEEDLEFERVMKAVPVVTEEAVQSLEEKIKSRILEGRFDDVVRLQPTDTKPFLPSRLLELNDKKSADSLAQIYENEYVAARDGTLAGTDKDEKLQKEHQEIETQWEEISSKLDALCNTHFTPKQPKATITTLSNVASTSMESALPTAKSASSILAPEEVFAPSSSDSRARSELTPAEKKTLHRKQRKAKRKARDTLEKSVDKYSQKVAGAKSVKKQKQDALKSVVKQGKGVTVIGKESVMGTKRPHKPKGRS